MKKIYSLISLFFIISTGAQTITFNDMADMPAAKSAISSATDGNYIYVTNGFSLLGGYTSDVFKYDIVNNIWSTLTNNTIAKRFGSSAIVGSYLFIFNGYVGNNDYNDDLEIVDLITGDVSNSSLVNPQPAASAGVAVNGSTIYSFGGNIANGYSNKLYALNTNLFTLTELAPMPIAAETKGEIVNGKLYTIGGFNGNASDKIYVYDIATNTWTNEYTLPQTLSANATAVVGDKIYVLGDFTDQTFSGYFDTNTNTFTETSSNLIARRHAAAESVNDQLYIMGGNTSSSGSSALSSVQKASITLSVENFENHQFSIYPNPATDIINFSEEITDAILFDLRGSILKEKSNIRSLNISSLQNGIYFLKLNTENNVQTIKFIKQ